MEYLRLTLLDRVEAGQAARLGWMRLWIGKAFQNTRGRNQIFFQCSDHRYYFIMPPLIGVVGVVVPAVVFQKYRLLVMLRNIPE